MLSCNTARYFTGRDFQRLFLAAAAYLSRHAMARQGTKQSLTTSRAYFRLKAAGLHHVSASITIRRAATAERKRPRRRFILERQKTR